MKTNAIFGATRSLVKILLLGLIGSGMLFGLMNFFFFMDTSPTQVFGTINSLDCIYFLMGLPLLYFVGTISSMPTAKFRILKESYQDAGIKHILIFFSSFVYIYTLIFWMLPWITLSEINKTYHPSKINDFPIMWLIFFTVVVYIIFRKVKDVIFMNGLKSIKLGENQFPEVYTQVKNCSQKLGFKDLPNAYIINSHNNVNAMVIKNEIYISSKLCIILKNDSEALNFIIGHELGHIDRKSSYFFSIMQILDGIPILGCIYNYYRRREEYYCDKVGVMCCNDKDAALRGLTAVTNGTILWEEINIKNLIDPHKNKFDFLQWLGENFSTHPSLEKRISKVLGNKLKEDSEHVATVKLNFSPIKLYALTIGLMFPSVKTFSILKNVGLMLILILLIPPVYKFYLGL